MLQNILCRIDANEISTANEPLVRLKYNGGIVLGYHLIMRSSCNFNMLVDDLF